MGEATPPPTALVYVNGELRPAGETALPLSDQGVLYGAGFFETFRTSGGRAHHWRYHQRRLAAACATAGLTWPQRALAADEERLAEVVAELLRAAGAVDAVFRYTITAGAADGGPAEFLTLRALPAAAPVEGIAVRVLRLRRDNGEWLPRPKSLNYANAWLGARELARRAATPHDEGVFLAREHAFVVEGTRQNIVWVRDGRLCFPDPALGAVAGTALAWALEQGVPGEAVRATVAELAGAEAVAVLNAVRGVTPVAELRGEDDAVWRSEWRSARHPVIERLRAQWSEALTATARGRGGF
ncbi:aminotransferase class IV [Horticoccus luteus]|uniref:Aminotransferase class IV n=1 Tax=Horticoccus luteus TaxID=2862869 RepID=A0A8F9TUG8_9BACT|nr:aminotransferase class IV [Horticoccus luteus]QYM78508.1 aminotransferase class IV [Horticoccus luteus]